MRSIHWLTCLLGVSWILASCASPAASQSPSDRCARDSDCVVVEREPCCAPCCSCPYVSTRAAARMRERRCARVDCDAPDCSHMRCEPCGIVTRAICEQSACVAR